MMSSYTFSHDFLMMLLHCTSLTFHYVKNTRNRIMSSDILQINKSIQLPEIEKVCITFTEEVDDTTITFKSFSWIPRP